MKKNNSLWLTGTLLFLLSVINKATTAQGNLQPGDEAPAISIPFELKGKAGSLALQNKSPKLIILDFWNTWCGSCIKSLPKIDALQQKFINDVRIIAVTDQDQSVVHSFLKKKGLVLNHISLTTGDSILKRYFPYQSLPHTVWISAGKVTYVTYGHHLNEVNISKFLGGNKPVLPVKDGIKQYDKNAPLWAKSNSHFSMKPERYSYLSGWINDYGSSIEKRFVDSFSKGMGIRMINVPLHNLIVAAFGSEYKFSNRVIKEGLDASNVLWGISNEEEEERIARNIVCYELKIPFNEGKNMRAHMVADLNRYLDFDIVVESRNVCCNVIVKRNEGVEISSGCTRIHKRNDSRNDGFYFCGKFASLIFLLQQKVAKDSRPIIDKSEYSGNVHIEWKGKLEDATQIRAMLSYHGFSMVERYCDIDMLILRDKPYKN